MPGKKGNYLKTLRLFLEFVAQNAPSRKQVQEWIRLKFSSLRKEKVVNDRVNTLLSLGLTTQAKEGPIKLTASGEQFLKTQNSRIVYENLALTYEGFQEILEMLQEKPKTLDEITLALKEKIGTNWETTAQVKIRLSWLEELGCLKKKWRIFLLNRTRDSYQGERN